MLNKDLIKESLKAVLSDRPILLLGVGLVASMVIYLLAVGLSIHASDVTVYTRYTAFGEAHFYKSPWQYLLLLAAFGVVVTFVHLSLLVKLHQIGRRQSAAFIGWMGISILVLALVYSLAVISLGRAT